ncbi:hypothetical protein C6497_06600 [Candidatus Poribacteria bacterium]|nr:MAG: hypothetical protein C6497_06600 [Candidatus Poribacteria bacterium]
MKPIFFFIMIFGTTILPAFSDLNSNNLNEIRLIVQEEVKAEITVLKKNLKAEIGKNAEKIETLGTRFDKVEQSVAWMRGNLDKVHQQTAWIIALIIVAIGIPQMIVYGVVERIVQWKNRLKLSRVK